MTAPILHTDRLTLEPLGNKHHSVEYVNWMNDSDVNRYMDSGGDYTAEKLRSFLDETEQAGILFWAILIKDSNKHIGNIKIDPVDTKHGLCEYGIMMGDKTEWGKGYAKEASLAVISYCFEQLNLRKMTLGVIESNTNAVELYKKMDFEIEGSFKAHRSYNGTFYDVLIMALFNKNWKNG